MMVSDKKRIYIIHDSEILREGLRLLIDRNPDMVVVGDSDTKPENFDTSLNTADIVLLYDNFSNDNGADVISNIAHQYPNVRLILLTDSYDPIKAETAVHRGAMGIFEIKSTPELLSRAIRKVSEGEVWLDRALIASILNRRADPAINSPRKSNEAKIATLTERERQVIALVGQGLRNKAIGERLFITETTVRNHLSSVFAKLGVSDRFELVVFAFQYGLADMPS
jgi:DNA-binding NarL/FixJ family response regulator